jgi:amino acid transporter
MSCHPTEDDSPTNMSASSLLPPSHISDETTMPSSPSDTAAARQPLLGAQREANAPIRRDDSPARGTFTRNLGAIEAFGIVVSVVIGSGVFTSPGAIDTNVPSPGVALVIWLVGGILAWTGATTFAELGTAIPGEGGVQPYLQHIYGDVWGFLAAWTWIVAVMPATLAILSIVFVESAYSAAGVVDAAGSLSHKLLSVLVLLLVSAANSINTRASTRLNSFFVVLKFLSILVVVVASVAVVALHFAQPERHVGGGNWHEKPWFGYRASRNPDGSETDWEGLSQWEIFGHYSAALYAALWAYSGWDKAIYVSAELSQPARQLPLAINTSLPTIILCFLAANTGYYILLPWNVVSTTDSVAVVSPLGHPFRVSANQLRLPSPAFSDGALVSPRRSSSALSSPDLFWATHSSPAAWLWPQHGGTGSPASSPSSAVSAGPAAQKQTLRRRTSPRPCRTRLSTPFSSRLSLQRSTSCSVASVLY